MIPVEEIQDKARAHDVWQSTVERDYAQNWFLKALFNQDLDIVLKGGTGIRKVHIPGYRFSDDLDFGLLQGVDEKLLRNRISDAAEEAGEESGIAFERDIRLKQNINGYEGRVYFRILSPSTEPIRIKLDFTGKKNEIILFPTETKPIIHPYSDAGDCAAHVAVYSLEETVSEKVRSLFQRVRPRDLYDIWALYGRINKTAIPDAVGRKCAFNKVKMNPDDFRSNKERFSSRWKRQLEHQMDELPEFEAVFEGVLEILEEM